MEIEAVTERDDHYDVTGAVTCWNEEDEEVMTGTVEGLIWK
jgi:hypothetical protein